MSVRFVALQTPLVRKLQAGGEDANGQTPERHISSDPGVPCRHCLQLVAHGEPYLILAHRPFPAPQRYAEQGPILSRTQRTARFTPRVARCRGCW